MGRATLMFGIVALTVFSALGSAQAEPRGAVDEQILKQSNIDTDGAGLLAFFRRLSLSDAERFRLEESIRQLGSPAFKVRAQATQTIIAMGASALPALRPVLQNPDPEVGRRAQACVDEIERGHASEAAQAGAAAHLLALRKPAGAVESLIAYLPFNEDEWVEEEVLAALRELGQHEGKLDVALLPALKSPFAARRAAAAYVVGRYGDAEQRGVVRNLLADADGRVRLRAAQALLVAGDKSAVPALIALLGDVPANLSWKAEELLYRIAGEQAPPASMGDGSVEARQRYRDAWAAWWRDQGQHADLRYLEDGPQHLGLTLVAEMDSNKVWEFGPDGKPRWRIEHLTGPMDAQVLPGGRVLIAEYQGRRVTERDLQGNILWSKRLNGSPIACQRLPNGNTFIATHNAFVEITRDGKEIPVRNPLALFLFSAQKLTNGHIVCMANPGVLHDIDADGKVVKTIRVGKNNGGWCGIEALPGGRFLITLFGSGQVLEVDGSGKKLWECVVSGACHATRLPNGHTLVASMMNHRIVEVDRDGKTVKETPTDGRPWRVHQR
jgi:hypothetical protein